jgi:chorismate mutase/prephenate dehydratase
MAKGKPAHKPSKSRGESPTQLRAKVERLDRELIKLVNERAELAARHDSTDETVNGLTRDEKSLDQLVETNKGPLAPRCVRAIFRELYSGSRELTHKVRVAYLGPAYSYSHIAAITRFGDATELVPVGCIAAVFEEVQRGHVKYGLVPLENSTDGRVADTLDMFTRLPIRICGEVVIEIHHNLLAKCPREQVQEVYSRPQAISQCRNWLSKHMPASRIIEMTSTSTAAELAQKKIGAAAIASIQAGVHYGLEVLAENIEDHAANVTRFAVIGQESSPKSGNDKTAVLFEVDHKVGALADATTVLKRNRLNMTWIESFPVPDRPGAYLFFVEVEGHESEPRLKRAMSQLGRKALRLEVIGSYRRATVPA